MAQSPNRSRYLNFALAGVLAVGLTAAVTTFAASSQPSGSDGSESSVRPSPSPPDRTDRQP